MKMASVSSVTLILLCCSVVATKGDDCDKSEAEGADFTLPLKYTLGGNEKLMWKFKDSIIYAGKTSGTPYTGMKTDIDQSGGLKRTKVTKDQAGIYTSEVFGTDGKRKSQQQINLCVIERVKKPSAVFKCKDSEVIFTCNHDKQPTSVSYEWREGDKVVGTEKSLKKVVSEIQTNKFTCKVSNTVSTESSQLLSHGCVQEVFAGLPAELFGISIWIFIGSGAGIVVLLIILVIVCCVRAKRKRSMQLEDEEELRLGWTSSEPQNQHHCLPPLPGHHPNNAHLHQHHQQQHPAGHTGPRQSRSKQHRQQRPRAPEPSEGQPQPQPRRSAQTTRPVQNDDEDQPPPLPQPRKKAAK